MEAKEFSNVEVNADCILLIPGKLVSKGKSVKNLSLKSTRHLNALTVVEVSAISLQPMRQITSGQTTLSQSGFCGRLVRGGGQAHKNLSACM